MSKYPAISEPVPTPESLHNTVLELKQLVEILSRQRKSVGAGAVTWEDLLALELITPSQVPDGQV